MRLIVVPTPGGNGQPHEVELVESDPTATLGDLLAHTGGIRPSDETELWVDGHPHRSGDRLADAELLEGSLVGFRPLPSTGDEPGWTASLSGGLHSGLRIPLHTRPHLVIGRAPQADVVIDSPSASWLHTSLRLDKSAKGVWVRDENATNGTWLNGRRMDVGEQVLVTEDAVVAVGGATILVRRDGSEPMAPPPGSLHNQTPAGTVPFNRPPRPGVTPGPSPVSAPTRRDVSKASRFSIAAVLSPLVLAVGMIFMMGSLRYALIGLLSPVMAVGTWWESKRRSKKDQATEDARFDEACNEFVDALDAAGTLERAHWLDEAPDPATTAWRAVLPSTRLWQRRPGSEDFMVLHAGTGTVGWDPPVDRQSGPVTNDDVKNIMARATIPAAPIRLDLTKAGVVGITGDRGAALAIARSLVMQACVHVGPADLTLGVFTDQGRESEWDWTTWLPHTRQLGGNSGDRWVSAQSRRSGHLLHDLQDNVDQLPTPALMLVVDSDVLLEGRVAPARLLLGHGRNPSNNDRMHRVTRVSGIVVAATEEQLPAACTVVIHADQDAGGTVSYPETLRQVTDPVLSGIDVAQAHRVAVALAHFEDPDLVIPGASLPSLVRLPPLMDMEPVSSGAIRQAWATSPGVSTPIGVGEQGTFTVDLVRDGPHGLVGGTTGSGKSEFLRSLIAGLAARNDPTKLTFILIDFKGGAAFKPCERLPHTIGTVSNLDEQLAHRVLQSLEAEMEYRQRVFAKAGEGIDNLDAYLATKPAKPMPRLLLVVDEFAQLAKELPDVLTSLVSIGAVGRTLGVHMILATQRPAGVVNDDLLANTNMRVALRVQSRDDSSNVIGVPDAAAIGRQQQGRAYIKLGQDDITPVQTALVTGHAQEPGADIIQVREINFGAPPRVGRKKPRNETTAADLDLLIDAIVEANNEMGLDEPRPVWPEPLGERVDLAGFTAADVGKQKAEPDTEQQPTPLPVVGGMDGQTVVVGLSDDPDHQSQNPAGWNLGQGNMLLIGIPGSGTTTALATIGLNLTASVEPEEMDLAILDMGAGDLAPLADLPHTVAYVGAGSGAREQQQRLLRHLHTELEERRATPGPHHPFVLLLDGLGSVKEEFQDMEGMDLFEGFLRFYADGPEVNMWCCAATARIKAIPAAVEDVTTQRWVFRLADRYDYSGAGLKTMDAPPAVPGRCVDATTRLQTHVATPDCTMPQAVEHIIERWPQADMKDAIVGSLPSMVTLAEVGAIGSVKHEPWRLPVGVRSSDLGPATLEVYEGEHILIAGPARSGKSTALLTLAESARAAAEASDLEMAVWGICGRRSLLVDADLDQLAVGADDIPGLVSQARVHQGRLLLLIDDAEGVDDTNEVISGLIGAKLPNLHIAAAGRADDLKSMFGHWTKVIRKSRCGLLLVPSVDFDGDLLGANIPRRAPVAMTTGRGYAVVSGSADLTQTAVPSDAPTSG